MIQGHAQSSYDVLKDVKFPWPVADVVEAMSSHRPYRAGLGIEAAMTEIERGSGTRYDPTVAGACLKLFREKDYTILA